MNGLIILPWSRWHDKGKSSEWCVCASGLRWGPLGQSRLVHGNLPLSCLPVCAPSPSMFHSRLSLPLNIWLVHDKHNPSRASNLRCFLFLILNDSRTPPSIWCLTFSVIDRTAVISCPFPHCGLVYSCLNKTDQPNKKLSLDLWLLSVMTFEVLRLCCC